MTDSQSAKCHPESGRRIPAWKRWLQASPATAFFLLTYLISWTAWGLGQTLFPSAGRGFRFFVHNLGLCGPTLAALLLSGLLQGRKGPSDLLKRIGRWRAGIGWYLFALFSTLALGLAARGTLFLAGLSTPPLDLQVMWVQILLLPSGLPEEWGWRGFALPHLMKKRSALAASLFIALFWALWHLPISPALKNPPVLGLFLLEVIPLTLLFSWLYLNTRGSILLAVLYHFFYNLSVSILSIPASRPLWVIYVGLTWAVTLLVLARYGASLQGQKRESEKA